MNREQHVVIEVFGEGKTDVGDVERDPKPQRPTKGVVPILLDRLCGKSKVMLVKRYGIPFLQNIKVSGRGYKQKAEAARKQARRNGSHAVVFVVDSEGDLKARSKTLKEGRDAGPSHPPMAVGVAHPCIESWLLTDAATICRALDMSSTPEIPDEPEKLPAPSQNRENNPKTVLRNISGQSKKELPTKDKDRIAAAMNDMDLVRERCPLGFAPFAEEVEKYICPLF